MRTLLIIDMQNDFMPGGPLGVQRAFDIIPVINRLIPRFPLVLATKDWHPSAHISFASNHLGKHPGEVLALEGVQQILWPIHCVQDTPGAEFVPSLDQAQIEQVFHKGGEQWIDSYSAFFDNARRKETGLREYLQTREITDLYIVGVATDYCVLYSVLDALDLDFSVRVVADACAGIDLQEGDCKEAFAIMRRKGAEIITSANLTI